MSRCAEIGDYNVMTRRAASAHSFMSELCFKLIASCCLRFFVNEVMCLAMFVFVAHRLLRQAVTCSSGSAIQTLTCRRQIIVLATHTHASTLRKQLVICMQPSVLLLEAVMIHFESVLDSLRMSPHWNPELVRWGSVWTEDLHMGVVTTPMHYSTCGELIASIMLHDHGGSGFTLLFFSMLRQFVEHAETRIQLHLYWPNGARWACLFGTAFIHMILATRNGPTLNERCCCGQAPPPYSTQTDVIVDSPSTEFLVSRTMLVMLL